MITNAIPASVTTHDEYVEYFNANISDYARTQIREDILAGTPLPLGTVPLYGIAQRPLAGGGDPADFTEEIVRYTLIWLGFVGAAYAFSTREHIALEFFRDKFPPAGKHFLIIAMDVLILATVFAIMVVGGIKLVYSARMEFSPILHISRSLVYTMGPVSGILICFLQIVHIWEDVTGIDLNKEKEAE